MKKLRIGFSPYGLLIVALQLFPNIIWAMRPPVPDALAGNCSAVPFIEYGEHVVGVAIVIMLLFLVNRKKSRKKIPRGDWATCGFVAIALYWLCWMLYLAGIQPLPVIYAMVILPPIAFFSAGIAGRIWPVSVASVVFMVFHLLVALENFPLGP